jgi:hypothetical protein
MVSNGLLSFSSYPFIFFTIEKIAFESSMHKSQCWVGAWFGGFDSWFGSG